MKASEIMTKSPKTVKPTQSVAEAVKIMEQEDCGAVPVVNPDDEGLLMGIITDRDIALRACCDGGQGPETSVKEVMSSELAVVKEEDDLNRVRQVMTERAVRRVPVVDGSQRLVGIISLKDIADESRSSVVGQVEDKILEQKPNN